MMEFVLKVGEFCILLWTCVLVLLPTMHSIRMITTSVLEGFLGDALCCEIFPFFNHMCCF